MMRIYQLSQMGSKLARSTSNPDTQAWRVVHYLDIMGHATPDQVASGTGMSEGEASGTLATLKRKGIVAEVGGGGNF